MQSKMRYCRKCETKYFSPKIDKCDICGSSLVDGEKLYPSKVMHKFRNMPPFPTKVLIIIITVVAVMYFTSVFLGFTTGFSIGKNCREVEEYYYGEVPYEVDAVYAYYPKYRVLESSLSEQWGNQTGFYYSYTVMLQNLDSDDYYYTVQFMLDTTNHGRLNSLVKMLVKSRENATFDAFFDTDLKERADGKFIVYPEPLQKLGKAVRMRNETLSRKLTKCF